MHIFRHFYFLGVGCHLRIKTVRAYLSGLSYGKCTALPDAVISARKRALPEPTIQGKEKIILLIDYKLPETRSAIARDDRPIIFG